MAGIKIDTSELRTLAADMQQVEPRLARRLKPAVNTGAAKIKADLTAQMKSSRHFKGFAAIGYDLDPDGFGAEIGPNKPGPGSGANIAYFGTSRGGGTVEDPVEALNREAGPFADILAQIAAEAALE